MQYIIMKFTIFIGLFVTLTCFAQENSSPLIRDLNNLAVDYLNSGVINRREEAFQLLTKAAKQGDPIAQYNLGVTYTAIFDWYSEKDQLAWFTQSALQGYSEAQAALSSYYAVEDQDKSLFWGTKAAEQGQMEAQHFVGSHYVQESLFISDKQQRIKMLQQGIMWLDASAVQGWFDAQQNLGFAYKTLYSDTHDPQNLIKSYAWFTVASKNGSTLVTPYKKEIAEHLSGDSLYKAKILAEEYYAKPIHIGPFKLFKY